MRWEIGPSDQWQKVIQLCTAVTRPKCLHRILHLLPRSSYCEYLHKLYLYHKLSYQKLHNLIYTCTVLDWTVSVKQICVKKLSSLKLSVRTMWWYQSTKTAKIFSVTLDGAMHGASWKKWTKHWKVEGVYFAYMGRRTPCTDWAQILFGGRCPRRNHVIQIWWRSVKGFRVSWGSNFTLSHWLWWSSLQHSHTTM